MISRLPVPLRRGERLILELDAAKVGAQAQGQGVEVLHRVDVSPNIEPALSMVRLVTDYREQRGPGTPTTFPVLETFGATKLVSQVEEITGGNQGERGFLEGDEMIRLDAMRYPLHLGTGTEDYFNGGFYFRGVHDNPLSGLTRFKVVDDSDSWKHATYEYSMYRHHLLDPLVGRSGIKFGWEAGDDGKYLSASFRTLVLAYAFDRPSEVGRTRFVLGKKGTTSEVSFGEAQETVTSALDAESFQVPSAFSLRRHPREATRLLARCPDGSPPTGLLLIRDYDAGVSPQGASVSINGAVVAHFFEAHGNRIRRFAQDSLWIDLLPDDCTDGAVRIDVRAVPSPDQWTESAYEVVFHR
ncbi:MAG: hypothetical protein NVSMB1_23680 [Polyangiales bacterium]